MCDEALSVDLVEEVTHAIGLVRCAAMPRLSVEQIEIPGFHEKRNGFFAVKGRMFWVIGLLSRIMAIGDDLSD